MTAHSSQHSTEAPSDTAEHDNSAPLTPEQCHAEAERLVQYYSVGGTAIGLVPVPLLDMAALAVVQLKMLHALAGLYHIDFRADLGRAAIASLLGGVLPSTLAPSLAASLGKLIPGAGQLLGAGTQAVLGGALTYAVGKVFIQHFAAGGTFLTFDPEAVRDYFEQQLEAGKAKAQAHKTNRQSQAERPEPNVGQRQDADPVQ
jgi:uncharacterized protein (DUF697 family)